MEKKMIVERVLKRVVKRTMRRTVERTEEWKIIPICADQWVPTVLRHRESGPKAECPYTRVPVNPCR
jgi:hypothetical protein